MTAPEGIAGEDPARVLDELPGFRAMPEDVRRLVADACELVAYDFGNVIVHEGDDADAFYILVSGTARVVKHAGGADEVSLNLLRRGDSFGEIGLLAESSRVATVRASGPVQALRLDRVVFRALTRRHPEVRAAVRAPGANPDGAEPAPPPLDLRGLCRTRTSSCSRRSWSRSRSSSTTS